MLKYSYNLEIIDGRINLLHELIECSKSARYVIDWIMKEMVWCPYEERILFIVKVNPTSVGRQVLKQGYKELFDKDLVRRVKRGYYMINPNAVITDHATQIAMWNSLPSRTVATDTSVLCD